ncbi:MAG: hypothetical protein NZ809_03495 [Thermodesulfovibrio sp.]|nr:hypothetical protein [Thermodesulfovibrio sp.]
MHPVVVLHFDETYFYQKKLINSAIQIDLRNIGKKFICDEHTLRLIESKIPKINCFICFIGKGEYHYVSFVLLKRLRFPFVLTVVDNHLDMKYSEKGFVRCDSWVYWAAKLKNVKRIYFINSSNIKRIFKTYLPVYMSIDKDILDKKYLNTRWTQGNVSLEELCNFIYYFFKKNTLLGIDICGEPDFEDLEEIKKSEKINLTILNCLSLKSVKKSA